MSERYTCCECSEKIQNGHAVLRSIAWRLVAWCHGCYHAKFLQKGG